MTDRYQFLLLHTWLTDRQSEEDIHRNGLIDLVKRNPTTQYDIYIDSLIHDANVMSMLLSIVNNPSIIHTLTHDQIKQCTTQLHHEETALKKLNETDTENELKHLLSMFVIPKK